MAWTVNAPDINQLTGEPEGDFTIQQRGLTRFELTHEGGDEVDPEQYNNAIAPHYARKAAEANLPIFHEDAADADVINFWRSSTPLTDAEIDAIQSAYVATDNEDIANLLMFKLTGDTSLLTEDQLDLLGLIDDEPSEANDEEIQAELELTNYIYDNADEPDQETAEAILQLETDGSDASLVVQHFAYQYYNGSLTLDEAYEQAIASGVNTTELAAAFNQLHSLFNAK